MRRAIAAIFALACLAGLSGCSQSAPPAGRWEGTYDNGDTIIAARVEINDKGDIYLSAPDMAGMAGSSAAEHEEIHTRLSDGLTEDWGSVAPRKMDFDGKMFRKPGGIAPQMEWDSSNNTMTIYVYLGNAPAVTIPLHPVKDFSANPFPSG